MRHWRLFFLSAALLALPVFWPCPHAMAQTAEVEPISASQPCDEIGRPGRPTLVRRVMSDSQTTRSVDQKTVEGKCPGLEDRSDRRLVSLRFVGLNTLSEKEVMRFFQEEGVPLRLDRLPDPETANRAAAVLKKLLSSKGHDYAIVSVFRDEDLNSITFQVIEGERLSLADIQFEGLRVFSSDALKAITRQCLSNSRAPTAYDQEGVEYCLRHAAHALRSRGYLQAKFGKLRTENTGHGIMLTLPMEEGPLYRLGEIKIEGSTRFSAAQIRAMFPLVQGEVASGSAISKWLFEDLWKLYGDLGYLEYIAEPDPTYKKSGEGEGIVDLRVIIDEGKQFRLRSLKFEGHQLPAEELRNYSALQVGEIYSVSAFQDFVNKLNESELFEPIDRDGDTNFFIDQEEELVSITLKLRRRSQH